MNFFLRPSQELWTQLSIKLVKLRYSEILMYCSSLQISVLQPAANDDNNTKPNPVHHCYELLSINSLFYYFLANDSIVPNCLNPTGLSLFYNRNCSLHAEFRSILLPSWQRTRVILNVAWPIICPFFLSSLKVSLAYFSQTCSDCNISVINLA